MSSSSSPAVDRYLSLDLSAAGLAKIDPARIDEAVAAGQRAGYEAGLAEARRHTASITAATAAEHRDHLERLLASCEAAVEVALSGVEAIADATARVTASAAFSVVEAILARELAVAANPGRDAVARALALSPDGIEVTLRLHPDDVAALGADDLPPGRIVKIVADSSVGTGDCIADAGWTRIDARLSTALERVRTVLESGA